MGRTLDSPLARTRSDRSRIDGDTMSDKKIPPPGCVWAQRPKHIILAVCLTDVKDPVIKVEKNKLYFKGVGGTEMKEHEVEMEFFKDIDVEKTKYAVRPREVSFVLEKVEEGPYWDRLLAGPEPGTWATSARKCTRGRAWPTSTSRTRRRMTC